MVKLDQVEHTHNGISEANLTPHQCDSRQGMGHIDFVATEKVLSL
ncbi:MAG: hypothetical protein OEY65_07685 [Gammaproteobacteria bacterium]|nr:hypothetical protein [Gammaproteobacteria bacterium]